MKMTVLIPTWKRGELLEKCLDALTLQIRLPDEVVVVYRDEDEQGKKIIHQFESKLPLRKVVVDKPGVIHAENSGLQASSGEVICFLDDDAVAPNHWLELIEQQFEMDKDLAGIGGPDSIVGEDHLRVDVDIIGKVTWFGKIIGNHHQKGMSLQEVDVLKGVNMSFRKSYIEDLALDDKLHSEHSYGNGSYWELDLCLSVKEKRGKMIFDPYLELDHHSNHQHFVKLANVRNSAHNMIYVLLKHFSIFRKVILLFYLFFMGNTQIVGLGKLLQMILMREKKAFAIYWNSNAGALAGIRSYLFL
jgi:glycosyltransferase involved in cell wall biosynthesis